MKFKLCSTVSSFGFKFLEGRKKPLCLELELQLFSIFIFLYGAGGVIVQLRPLFMANRAIFEIREKMSKTYNWVAFITGLMNVKIPYLVLCGTLYFADFYFAVRLRVKAGVSSQIYLETSGERENTFTQGLGTGW